METIQVQRVKETPRMRAIRAEAARVTERFVNSRKSDPRMRSYLAARASGCIAYSPTGRSCVCAPCLRDCEPTSDWELEILGVLVVADSNVPDDARFCSSCGSDLLMVIQ